MQCLHNLMPGVKKTGARPVRALAMKRPAQGRNLGAEKYGNKRQQENEHSASQWQQPWNDVDNGFGGVNFALVLVVVLGRRHESS